MIAAADHDDASHLKEAYGVFVCGLRLRQAKIGYLLPLALVPAALSLDYFVYPELLGALITSRLLCNLALAPCYIMLFTRLGPRNLFWLGNAWLMSPMLIICWMIYASEGANSPYYAGLNLVMLAGCLLTTYNARRASVFCGFTIVCATRRPAISTGLPRRPRRSINRRCCTEAFCSTIFTFSLPPAPSASHRAISVHDGASRIFACAMNWTRRTCGSPPP